MRHDTIASFLQKKFLAKIVTYGSLASRWRFNTLLFKVFQYIMFFCQHQKCAILRVK